VVARWAPLRVRPSSGDLGPLPVIIGLAGIWIIFRLLNDRFLSPENLVNLALQMAAVGTIAVGVVLVLLLGEIDLSVGSVSGLCAALFAVLSVRHGYNPAVAILLALIAAAAIGTLHGLLFAKLGVPSFVVTLSGLIGWQGLQLYVLKPEGTLNIPFNSNMSKISRTFLGEGAGYAVALLIVGVVVATSLIEMRRRQQADLPHKSISDIAVRSTALAVLAVVIVTVLNRDRGVPMPLLLLVAIVMTLQFILRRTTFGRSVFAVGGNAEAARRAGINVTRIRVTVFLMASTLTAIGGLLAASRLSAVNQSSGGSDTLLNAIAAAVIGGTSLFGGRGSAYSALLGILVIQSISNGMFLLNKDSSVRFMITGIVLLTAVVIDTWSRRRSQGRLAS
jgi:D-xylose transport system permease protein